MSERNVQCVFDAWKQLDQAVRVASERDLQDVFFLGNDEGTRSLLAAGNETGQPLQQAFAEIDDPFDRAMWVRIERPDVWRKVQAFFPVDQLINKRYWRRYRDLPRKSISNPTEKAERLPDLISEFYWNAEGHGQRHKAEYQAKGKEADYFSVFIDDHPTREMRLGEDLEFTREPRPRVAEMAFVWAPKEGVARVYVERDAKTARTLFELFYREMFGKRPPRDDAHQSAYRLNRMLEPDWHASWGAGDGVRRVAVRRMRFSHKGDPARRITLEGNIEERGARDVFDMIDRFLDQRHLPRELLDVGHATFAFDLMPGRYGRRRSFVFDLNWPNGGNLHNQPEEMQRLGQTFLERCGIDIKACAAEDAWLFVLRMADQEETLFGDDTCETWPRGLRGVLENKGILTPAEPGSQVLCRLCNEPHVVTPETLDHPPHVRYRMACPARGDAPIVDAQRLNRWRVDWHALIRLTREVVRLSAPLREVVEGRVWRLGASTFHGIDAEIFFARGIGSLAIDERAHPFEPESIVVVPDRIPESPILARHGVRFIRLSDLLICSAEGLVANLDAVLAHLGVRSETAEANLEPWRFERPNRLTVLGHRYFCGLTAQQQRFVELASGKLTVPLRVFFQKNGSGLWKEKLIGGKGTERQRSKLTTLTNRLNVRLMDAGIALSFDLPRESYHIHIALPEVPTQ